LWFNSGKRRAVGDGLSLGIFPEKYVGFCCSNGIALMASVNRPVAKQGGVE
jgi:hypothetical protein